MKLDHSTGEAQAEPITEFEQDQSAQAWQDLRDAVRRGSGGLRLAAGTDGLARGVFTLGWAMCARLGTGAPALAGVPVLPDQAAAPVYAISHALAPSEPMVGQRVRYHGEELGFEGRYWVRGVEEHLHASGTGLVVRTYDLAERVGSDPGRVLRGVSRGCLTPLSEILSVHRP